LLAADEPRILCIIYNALDSSDKKVLNWPASTPCSDLIADVGKKLCLPTNGFDLVYELPISSTDEQRQVVFCLLTL